MANILEIEDEPNLLLVITYNLTQGGNKAARDDVETVRGVGYRFVAAPKEAAT